MKRREFITLVGGAAAMPLAARAQPRRKPHRIGLLMHLAADDPEAISRVAAFLQRLHELGWAVGHNVQIDYRWAVGDIGLYRKYAAELVAHEPDILVATVTDVVRALQQTTRNHPDRLHQCHRRGRLRFNP